MSGRDHAEGGSAKPLWAPPSPGAAEPPEQAPRPAEHPPDSPLHAAPPPGGHGYARTQPAYAAAPVYGPPPGYVYAPPPGYVYGPPPTLIAPAAPRASTNGMAIAALVLGLVWVYGVGSILAIIFGHLAMGQIDRSSGTQTGRGMGLAGAILGYVGVSLTVLVLIIVASF